jgi:hypothetical protein
MLLLVIIALAAAARIADSRRVSGLVMLAWSDVSVSERLDQAAASDCIDGKDFGTDHRRWQQIFRQRPSRARMRSRLGLRVSGSRPSGRYESPEPPSRLGRAACDRAGRDCIRRSAIEDITVETGEVIIPPRPDWVEAEDVRTGDIHTTAVSSGPHETERECRKALDRELEKAVSEYIDWYLGRVYDERFRASTLVRYDLDEIKQRLVPSGKIYHEVIRVSFGPMHQMHAQLAFDQAFRRELDSRRIRAGPALEGVDRPRRLLGIAVGLAYCWRCMGSSSGISAWTRPLAVSTPPGCNGRRQPPYWAVDGGRCWLAVCSKCRANRWRGS